MSDNKPEKEMELKKFYLKWLFEHAKMLQSQIDPAKEEETFDTLAQYFSQMIDVWQLIANETKLKDLQDLNNAIQRSFDCGVIFGMIFQHSDVRGILLRVIKENKDLHDKLRQFESMMPKQTEDLGYIR